MADYNAYDQDEVTGHAYDESSESLEAYDQDEVTLELSYIIEQGLLSQWAATYSPLVLLGLDETGGTVAEDSSGNGNDMSHRGTFSLAQPGLFSGDGQGVDYADGSAGNSGLWSPYPATSGADHAITFAVRLDDKAGRSLAFQQPAGSGARLIIGLEAAHLGQPNIGWYDEDWKLSSLTFGEGNEALLGLNLDSASSTGAMYLNGLPFFEDVYADQTLTGANNAALGGAENGTDHRANGLYSIYMHCDQSLAHADFYQQAVDVGAAPESGHYYKETIVDSLGLASLGVQGDVACHLPLWETAGSQAVDVSMYENHFDFIGGPALGADPPSGSNLLYSVDCPTDAGIQSTSTAFLDLFSDEYTASFWVRSNVAVTGGEQVFGQSGDSQTAYAAVILSGDGTITFQYFDGTKYRVKSSVTDREVWNKITLRRKASGEIEMWVNGTSQGTDTELTSSVPDNALLFGDRTSGFLEKADVNIAGPIVFSTALSDAECEAL